MNRKIPMLVTALVAVALALPASAQTGQKKAATPAAKPAAASSGKTIATVNGSPISQGMAQLLVEEQLSQGQPDSAEMRSAVREDLVKRELLAQEARKRGMDKTEAINARVDLARQSILLGAYLDQYVKEHPVTDAAVRAEYDRQVQLIGDKEYKLRHIQTEKAEDAVAIIKKLDAGGKFEELAKESKDLGSKDSGGDLGWMRPQADFAAAVAQLEKGKYSKTPVKTEYGYHVILLEDTRKPDVPDFEAAKERVQQALIQQLVQKHVTELMAKAKIE